MAEKKLYGKVGLGVIRSTFLIDPQGTIVRIWNNVRTKGMRRRCLTSAGKKQGVIDGKGHAPD